MKENRYQILVRLPNDIADELTRVSEDTKINKNCLCNIGITRLLNDIKSSNIDNTLREFSRG